MEEMILYVAVIVKTSKCENYIMVMNQFVVAELINHKLTSLLNVNSGDLLQ